MTERIWRQRWRWLLLPLTLMALAWTGWLLWDSLPALMGSLPQLKIGWLAFTLLGCCVSSYFGFEGFLLLFNKLRPGLYRRLPLAHFYFTGQLMKHMPGRIWGVAYQSAAGHRATTTEWIGITLVHMALTTAFAVWISAIALFGTYGWRPGLIALACGAGCYIFLWNRRLLLPLLQFVQKIRARSINLLCLALHPFANANSRFKIDIFLWFSASWLVYFLAWACFGMAWPGLDAADGIWLCALYTAAWLAGYLSMVSPSGIGVRELVFVGLAHNFPTDAVAGLAIFGRVMLLLVDIVLGMAFMPCRDSAHD